MINTLVKVNSHHKLMPRGAASFLAVTRISKN